MPPVRILDNMRLATQGYAIRIKEMEAGAGEVSLFGRTDDGTSVHERTTNLGSAPARVLVLDARVGLGQVEVDRG